MVVRARRHKASNTQNPPRFDALGGGVAGTERGGGESQARCLEGSRKNISPGHTPKGGCGVLVCVGAQWPWWDGLPTGRGDGDEVLSFLLNKIWKK
jgi:hypothetical protein